MLRGSGGCQRLYDYSEFTVGERLSGKEKLGKILRRDYARPLEVGKQPNISMKNTLLLYKCGCRDLMLFCSGIIALFKSTERSFPYQISTARLSRVNLAFLFVLFYSHEEASFSH